ncbi:hypothetical protein EPN87_04590 [archaeon]|nr:MAG: hypothetical protein EPN87_04590 [archaeon]
MKISSQAQIDQIEKVYCRLLFAKFLEQLPKFHKINPDRTIPFSYVYFWFSFQKMDRKAARQVTRTWIFMGLVERVRYHGIKLKGGE